jgi:glycosyltransferase involved in cell wall biosynthesis
MACSVLREEKGIQHLLAAMSRLVARRSGVALVVLGSGPFEAPLRAMTEELGLADVVTFMGHRSDVADLLPAADVFCHPTLLDVLPTVIIEAMAASLPVVASRTGGIPELVDNGVSGLLVEPGAPAPLAAALERVLSDPALAERFGVAGRRRVHQSFERTMQVDRLETLYRSVTGRDNHP